METSATDDDWALSKGASSSGSKPGTGLANSLAPTSSFSSLTSFFGEVLGSVCDDFDYKLVATAHENQNVKIKIFRNEYNLELIPRRGGKIVRAAGTSAKILAKEGDFVTLRLPSKEIRLVRKNCFATIGEVSNNDAFLTQSGKAGRTRWLGKRPTVRGSVMNPCDHPHGGGEGRTSIGRTRPLTPWGKPALGMKTRKNKKSTNAYILRRRS